MTEDPRKLGPNTRPRKLGLEDAYALRTPADNRALYRDWADTYESDFIAPRGYVYHYNVVRIFATFAGLGVRPILDVGCGTGIVGDALAECGYDTIDGIDISPEMLEQSARKNIYRHLIEADLTKTTSIEAGTYAGIISVGTFTLGHLGPETIGELLRIGTPDCQYAIGINAQHYRSRGFARWFDIAQARHAISTPTLTDVLIYSTADDDHANDVATVATFAKLTQ